MRNTIVLLLIGILFLGISCADEISRQPGEDWPFYGGNYAGNRYSPLDQISSDNVNELEVVWIYDSTGGTAGEPTNRQIQTQPIVVDGILYGLSPMLKLFALDASTGDELWVYDPSAEHVGYNSSSRGVMFWEDGDDQRILFGAGDYLHSIDARNGKLNEEFGDNGKLNFRSGLENSRPNVENLPITITTPGVIYNNTIVLGSTVSEAGDALPGHIRGFDIHTGELTWIFHTIPRPGEYGYETWEEGAYLNIGGSNSWAGLVLDEKRGVVYTGTGAPSPHFYGADRKGQNLFSNTLLALNAETGEMIWYYQIIQHDLWDWDISNPPNLITLKHNGQLVDAVVQTTKDGMIHVLDRDTGESLFPVEERPVPTEALPGEEPWPTQKFPLKPEPFSRQVYTNADLPDSTIFPEAHKYIKERLSEIKYGQKFIPPSEEGTMVLGIGGGAQWGGTAADPDGILYQNSSEMPWIVRMTDVASTIERSISYGNDLYIRYCAACHGADRSGGAGDIVGLLDIGDKYSADEIENVVRNGIGRMPSFQQIPDDEVNEIISFLLNPDVEDDQSRNRESSITSTSVNREIPYQTPYISRGGGRMRDQDGYPGIKPPWGTLNAIDLNTGEYLWRVPLGEHVELTEKGIPLTGTENTGGPLVTAGGLLFIGATQDERIRAFDKKTGEIVWEYELPAGGYATPISYSIDGKQYIAIAAGGVRFGTKPGGWYLAFALP